MRVGSSSNTYSIRISCQSRFARRAGHSVAGGMIDRRAAGPPGRRGRNRSTRSGRRTGYGGPGPGRACKSGQVTIEPPAPGAPRRPFGPRNPGAAWVVAPTGERYWGKYGAAGLLAIDPDRGVLLQHRVSWSHFGDTWALPGGARHEGESACDGALREAGEEAG